MEGLADVDRSKTFCVLLPSFRAQNDAERVIECASPVDPGIGRGVAGLYPSRGYTHPVTRAIEVSHAACKAEV